MQLGIAATLVAVFFVASASGFQDLFDPQNFLTVQSPAVPVTPCTVGPCGEHAVFSGELKTNLRPVQKKQRALFSAMRKMKRQIRSVVRRNRSLRATVAADTSANRSLRRKLRKLASKIAKFRVRRGPRGRRGARGKPGRDGSNGRPGKNGTPGRNGKRGAPGIRGGRGPRGVRGPRGATGKGRTGPRGPRGVRGPRGSRGSPGRAGRAGPRGPRGVRGSRGSRGPRGLRGRRGSRGPRGKRARPRFMRVKLVDWRNGKRRVKVRAGQRLMVTHSGKFRKTRRCPVSMDMAGVQANRSGTRVRAWYRDRCSRVLPIPTQPLAALSLSSSRPVPLVSSRRLQRTAYGRWVRSRMSQARWGRYTVNVTPY